MKPWRNNRIRVAVGVAFLTLLAVAAYAVSPLDACNSECTSRNHQSGYCEPTGTCNPGEVDIGQDGCAAFEACCCITTTTTSTTTSTSTTIPSTTTVPKNQYGCEVAPPPCSDWTRRCGADSGWDFGQNTCAWNAGINLCHKSFQYFACFTGSDCLQGDLPIPCNKKFCDCCDGRFLNTYANQTDTITCSGNCDTNTTTCTFSNPTYECDAKRVCSRSCDAGVDALCDGKEVNASCGNGGVCDGNCQCACPRRYKGCALPAPDDCFPGGACTTPPSAFMNTLIEQCQNSPTACNGEPVIDLFIFHLGVGSCCFDSCCSLPGATFDKCGSKSCYTGNGGGAYACVLCGSAQSVSLGVPASVPSGQTKKLATSNAGGTQNASALVESLGVTLTFNASEANPVGEAAGFIPKGSFFSVQAEGNYTPPVEVCLQAAGGLSSQDLEIYHYTNGGWQKETHHYTPDSVCSQTESLSWFVLGVPQMLAPLTYGWNLISLPLYGIP